jgi:D-alanyl-D-alanine carboxypeptidase
MRSRQGRVSVLALVVALAGCAPTPDRTEMATSVGPSASSVVSAAPSEQFPTAAFADISENSVSEEVAAEFQAALKEMAGKGGMTATVMSPRGTWSGAVGKADGVRDVRVDDQFAIGSVTKSLVAAQVMQMVEAGDLELDDPADDHLPSDLDFDTNGATIRHLLGMHSGIPDYWPELKKSLSTDRQRVWTTADLLELVPAERAPAGDVFEYTNTNYLLLELVIEQVRGRPVVDVLRDGVLSIDGTERLIYQPDEVPTEPMAMPYGESTAALKKGGGYLPSLASATAGPTTGAMASDSPSLARWWRAFCGGEIVSQASLDEMATFHDGYGLGLYNPAGPYEQGIGHAGEDVGYVSWAGCLPEHGSVVVVLHNRVVDDIGGMARPLVGAVSSD